MICGVRPRSSGAEKVLLSGFRVSFSALRVGNGERHVTQRRRIVASQDNRRVLEASGVGGETCGVAAEAVIVSNEGLIVEPRRSERG